MRILVVHGSTRGGTAGLAEMVAAALVARGVSADVGAASETGDPEGYDGVIVGGALYGGRWHPDAVAFVERHRGVLRELPVWFFSSGPLDDSARDGSLAPVPQVGAIARDIDIRGHMTFGGCLEQAPHGFLASLLSWGPAGDFRDPHQVDAWAERIAGQLALPRPPREIVLPDVDQHSGVDDDHGLPRVLKALGDTDDSEDVGLDVLL